MRNGGRWVASLSCVFLLWASGLPLLESTGTVHAAGPRVFFSEYVEGTGSNQALEIYNGTGAAVDLAAGGYCVEIYPDGSATPGQTIRLTGTVAANDVYVLARAGAGASILEQADQVEGGSWFDGNDAVVLRKGAARLDVIGQIGFDPGEAWGSHYHTTADSTLRRAETDCSGDSNGSDSFYPVGHWNTAVDALSGLGTHSARCPTLPVPLPLVYFGLLGICVGALYVIERKGLKLGIFRTFLIWLAAIVALMPLSEFIVARSDGRTIVLAATAELGLIALVAGIITGWRQRDRMDGVINWILVIIFSYVPVVISYNDAGARLNTLAGFSELGVIALSLVVYQASFLLTHWLKNRRR